jgi:P63C domain
MSEELTGKAKGGRARADSLTPIQRREIATKAAKARWGDVVPEAEFVGELKIGDMAIPCAVLEDGTRVLWQQGFLRAIGRTGRAAESAVTEGSFMLPVFLRAENLKPLISKEIAEASRPIVFRRTLPSGGGVSYGYRAELLPQVCAVFLDAEDSGVLAPTQRHIYERCKLLMRGLATVGITALVDEATGYQNVRPKDALQKYLEQIIRKELAAWAKKFPDEFYENIYKLKGWPWRGMKKNRYSVVAHYTRDLVYQRIAPTLLEELEKKSPKNDSGNRPNKLHQWLTDDIGNPMLAQHMHSLIMFQRLALASGFGWNRFVKMVDQVMPKRGATLELPFPEGSSPVPLLTAK